MHIIAQLKMKPIVNVKSYIDSSKEVNDINPKFKIGDNGRISKYKNVFAKVHTPNWSEEVFVIKKIKNTLPWTYIISDFQGKEIVGMFYENELQKANKKQFRIEKVIRRKSDNLYVKWKGYDSSFDSRVDKKRHSKNEWIISRTNIFTGKGESWIRFV